MTSDALKRKSTWPRWAILLAVFIGIALLIAANIHLVYVSVAYQPDCVPHLKAGHIEDGFRAARSSC